MAHYCTDRKELYVLDKRLRQEGRLLLSTDIDIRGNPKKGPVPVTVRFATVFTLDERYQEIDPEDGEVNWVSYQKDFDDQTDRDESSTSHGSSRVLSRTEPIKIVAQSPSTGP